jgi:hypothetical protein
MQTTVTSTSAAGTQGGNATTTVEPTTFSKRIGSTTYVVAVHFSRTDKEPMQDKILRLIESDPLVRSANWPGDRMGVRTSAWLSKHKCRKCSELRKGRRYEQQENHHPLREAIP